MGMGEERFVPQQSHKIHGPTAPSKQSTLTKSHPSMGLLRVSYSKIYLTAWQFPWDELFAGWDKLFAGWDKLFAGWDKRTPSALGAIRTPAKVVD